MYILQSFLGSQVKNFQQIKCGSLLIRYLPHLHIPRMAKKHANLPITTCVSYVLKSSYRFQYNIRGTACVYLYLMSSETLYWRIVFILPYLSVMEMMWQFCYFLVPLLWFIPRFRAAVAYYYAFPICNHYCIILSILPCKTYSILCLIKTHPKYKTLMYI